MNQIKYISLTIVIIVITSTASHAQFEPQFTQYMFNEMFINPAYAGSREQVSATMVYRNQWVGLDGAPKTQTASIHGPLMNKKLGVGLSVMNESIGVTKEFSVNVNYAYRLQFRASSLAFGLQGGLINHQENLSEVVTNEENDPEFLYNTPKVLIPNAGFGMYYNSDRFYAGISIPRMFENKISGDGTGDVTNDLNIETWHYYITSGYIFPVSDEVKLKPTMMIKAVSGAPVVGDFSLNALFKEKIWMVRIFIRLYRNGVECIFQWHTRDKPWL